MAGKRMTRKVYEGLREMRAYCNAGFEASELPIDEQNLEQTMAALAYFDWWLDRWDAVFDKEGNV